MVITDVIPKGLDLSGYIGQWVVICQNKVVAHSKNLKSIQKDIKACKRRPTIAKIPKEETWIF